MTKEQERYQELGAENTKLREGLATAHVLIDKLQARLEPFEERDDVARDAIRTVICVSPGCKAHEAVVDRLMKLRLQGIL